MRTMLTRRRFMRATGVAALAGCGLMLTGCDIAGSYIKSLMDDDVDLGKYTVMSAGALHATLPADDNITDPAISIYFKIYNADDALDGKKSEEIISDITIDGTAVTSVYRSDTIEVAYADMFLTTLSTATAWADYIITPDQYSAYFENGAKLKFTVTLAGKSAEYTLTYDKSKEGSEYGPITSKVEKKQ